MYDALFFFFVLKYNKHIRAMCDGNRGVVGHLQFLCILNITIVRKVYILIWYKNDIGLIPYNTSTQNIYFVSSNNCTVEMGNQKEYVIILIDKHVVNENGDNLTEALRICFALYLPISISI